MYLHNNKLSDAGLPERMFNGSDNLEVLILSSNFLRYVPKGLPTALFRLHLKVPSLADCLFTPEGSLLPQLAILAQQVKVW